MQLRISHTTRYLYPGPVRASHNEARLMPLTDSSQTMVRFRLETSPRARVFSYDSVSGRVHHFNLRTPHTEMQIRASTTVITHSTDPLAPLQLVADDGEFYSRRETREQYAEYLAPTPQTPLLPELDVFALAARKGAARSTASFLIALSRVIQSRFTYTRGATRVDTPLTEVLESKKGVCQDFAHLMLAICRRQMIPARYVSGYLYTGADGEDRPGSPCRIAGEGTVQALEAPAAETGEPVPEEASGRWHGGLACGDAMHAWVEALLPGGYWCGLDPTNGVLADDAYVKVQCGRDYADVPPLRGVYQGPATHGLEVTVFVDRTEA